MQLAAEQPAPAKTRCMAGPSMVSALNVWLRGSLDAMRYV